MHCPTIEIGTARGGGCRRIGDFIGASVHDADAVWRDAKIVGGDGDHLRMKPLPHFGAAVVDSDRSVGIDEDECASLVEHRIGEGDAEFDGHEADTAFDEAMRCIEGIDLGFSFVIARRFEDRIGHARDAEIGEFGAILHDIARRIAVVIEFADFDGFHAKVTRRAIEDGFDDDEALRAAKSAICRVRRHVCTHHVTIEFEIWNEIATVEVEEATIEDADRQIVCPTAVGIRIDVERQDVTVVAECGFILRVEGVSLARIHHILIAIEPDADGAAGDVCADSGQACVLGALSFFAAESATHSRHDDDDATFGVMEHFGDFSLAFARILARCIDENVVVFIDFRLCDLRFEVPVFLPRRFDFAFEDEIGLFIGGFKIAAFDDVVIFEEAAFGNCIADVENGFEGLDIDDDLFASGDTSFVCFAHDEGDSLPDAEDFFRGEDFFVACRNGRDVVDAGNVFGSDDCGNSGHVSRSFGIDASDAPVRDGRCDDIGDETVRRHIHIVDKLCAPCNVFPSALVDGIFVERTCTIRIFHRITSPIEA